MGMLFLMLVTTSVITKYGAMKLQEYEMYRLGKFIQSHPELEQELIYIYENEDMNLDNDTVSAGEALMKKYGYESIQRKSNHIFYSYGGYVLVSIGFYGILTVLGMLFFEHIENKKVRNNLQGLSACLENYLDSNFFYKFNGKHREDMYMHIQEQLVKLGNYMNLLREKMDKEENETKSLITDISHQLKTPLASLRMSYEIAATNTFTEEERNQFLLHGREEVRKLEYLLENLIQLSRLETNMIRINPESVSLKETLIASVSSVFMKAYEKQIEIIMEEFLDVKTMHDPKWTGEAFVNVLDNAIKYSNPDTKIHIRVSVMVSYILIEIMDEGIGIPTIERPNIFKRFYRGRSENVQKVEGSGVGLYLVRRILEEQGGTVRVISGNEKGSVFQLTLPKAQL